MSKRSPVVREILILREKIIIRNLMTKDAINNMPAGLRLGTRAGFVLSAISIASNKKINSYARLSFTVCGIVVLTNPIYAAVIAIPASGSVLLQKDGIATMAKQSLKNKIILNVCMAVGVGIDICIRKR